MKMGELTQVLCNQKRFVEKRHLFNHVIASRFLAKQSPVYQARLIAWDCFVAKNAPRNDKHNSFDARLNSYEKRHSITRF